MEITINQKDLIKHAEFLIRKYELEFKTNYKLNNEDGKIEANLKGTLEEIERNLERFKQAKFNFVLVGESKLNKINEELKTYCKGEVANAIKSKKGAIYDSVVRINRLLNQNLSKKEDLAKLHILINTLPEKEAKMLLDAIDHACVSTQIHINCSKQMKNDVTRFLNRVGISAMLDDNGITPNEKQVSNEICLTMASKKVWVALEIADKVKTNIDTIQVLSARLQVINAERQVTEFTSEREKEFVSLQERYLELLKERDELLKDFSKEDELVYRPLTTYAPSS